jgi:signal peptidase I
MQPEQFNAYTPPTSTPRSSKKIWILVIAGALVLTVLSFIISPLTVIYVVQPVRIEGEAMMPKLKHGDKVFMLKRIGELERGDIIVFLYPHDQSKSYIKRIVGLPGETIDIKDGKVSINGKLLDEPYLDPKFASHDTMPVPVAIPADQYFVLGDNRGNSSDSRAWGTVSRDLIYGKYWYRYGSAGQDE